MTHHAPERDIIERLMDFDGEGRTATERVALREAAATAIFRLRENHKSIVETKRRTNDRLRTALAALQEIYTASRDGFEEATQARSPAESPPK